MKAAFHTLGCRVNQYETEAMKKLFQEKGFTIVPEEEVADVYVINTCTVTALADRKSRQFIRRMRRQSPKALICATGCYVQSDPQALQDLEELDVMVGTNEKYTLADMALKHCQEGQEQSLPREDQKEIHIRPRNALTDFVEAGIVTSPDSRTRASIKIQDGCDRFCTYCVIPYARGPVRCREKEHILEEAKALLQEGYHELVLTGINTALYDDLPGLLAELDNLPGDFRVRLASLEPTVVDLPFIQELFKSKRLCHQLHLSLQSGSDKILKAMGRPYDGQTYLHIVEELRAFDPLFNFTTDIIVGFPGEEEEDFQDTLRVSKGAGFGRVHVFPYSQRPGTKAAEFPHQIAPPVKKERAAVLGRLGDQLAQDFCARHIGTWQKVLPEEPAPDNLLEACGILAPTGQDVPLDSLSEQGKEQTPNGQVPAVEKENQSAPARKDGQDVGLWYTGYTDNYCRVLIRMPEGTAGPTDWQGGFLTGKVARSVQDILVVEELLPCTQQS